MLVASANLGVLGLPSDDVVEVESEDDFRSVWRLRAAGRFLSSVMAMANTGTGYGERRKRGTQSTASRKWVDDREKSKDG